MNNTDVDINLKVTVVKLMGQDQEDVEVAWGVVPTSRIQTAYETAEAMPKSFPVDLNNADGVDGTLKVKF